MGNCQSGCSSSRSSPTPQSTRPSATDLTFAATPIQIPLLPCTFSERCLKQGKELDNAYTGLGRGILTAKLSRIALNAHLLGFACAVDKLHCAQVHMALGNQ